MPLEKHECFGFFYFNRDYGINGNKSGAITSIYDIDAAAVWRAIPAVFWVHDHLLVSQHFLSLKTFILQERRGEEQKRENSINY